jgi:hypothetical protein
MSYFQWRRKSLAVKMSAWFETFPGLRVLYAEQEVDQGFFGRQERNLGKVCKIFHLDTDSAYGEAAMWAGISGCRSLAARRPPPIPGSSESDLRVSPFARTNQEKLESK